MAGDATWRTTFICFVFVEHAPVALIVFLRGDGAAAKISSDTEQRDARSVAESFESAGVNGSDVGVLLVAHGMGLLCLWGRVSRSW